MARENLVNNMHYLCHVVGKVAVGLDSKGLNALAAEAGPIVTTGCELLVFTPSSVRRALHAKGNWINGDLVINRPSGSSELVEQSSYLKMQLGVAHLKAVVRVSIAAQCPVAFNPNVEALFLYGSSDLNVLIWLPNQVGHLSNLGGREIGQLDSAEEIQDSLLLERAAKYFGWAVCRGGINELAFLLAHRHHHAVRIGAKGSDVPKGLAGKVVKMKLFADYLRQETIPLDFVDNDEEGTHLFYHGYRNACICHGDRAEIQNHYESFWDKAEVNFHRHNSGLAIVAIIPHDSVQYVVHHPILIHSPTLALGADSDFEFSFEVKKRFNTDKPLTFDGLLENEAFGVDPFSGDLNWSGQH